jgi:hypothetical protein
MKPPHDAESRVLPVCTGPAPATVDASRRGKEEGTGGGGEGGGVSEKCQNAGEMLSDTRQNAPVVSRDGPCFRRVSGPLHALGGTDAAGVRQLDEMKPRENTFLLTKEHDERVHPGDVDMKVPVAPPTTWVACTSCFAPP